MFEHAFVVEVSENLQCVLFGRIPTGLEECNSKPSGPVVIGKYSSTSMSSDGYSLLSLVWQTTKKWIVE